jgi:hypothetical protein
MGEWDRPVPDPALRRLAALQGRWESQDEHLPMPWAKAGGSGRSPVGQPFTTPSGRSRATLRVIPASCITATTSLTSL